MQNTGEKSFKLAVSDRRASQLKNWMDEDGISEQSYYHWQRRFRKEMKENTSVPAVVEKTELGFVEIPCIAPTEINMHMVSNKPVAIIVSA